MPRAETRAPPRFKQYGQDRTLVRSPSQPHSGERGATGGTQREDPCLARRHAYPVSSSSPALPVASTWHGRTRVASSCVSSQVGRAHDVPERTIALSMTSNFRIQAVMITL